MVLGLCEEGACARRAKGAIGLARLRRRQRGARRAGPARRSARPPARRAAPARSSAASFFWPRAFGITRTTTTAAARRSTGPAALERPAPGAAVTARAAPRRAPEHELALDLRLTSGGSSLSVSRSTSAPSMPASTGGGARLGPGAARRRRGAREAAARPLSRRRERRRDALALAGLEVCEGPTSASISARRRHRHSRRTHELR